MGVLDRRHARAGGRSCGGPAATGERNCSGRAEQANRVRRREAMEVVAGGLQSPAAASFMVNW